MMRAMTASTSPGGEPERRRRFASAGIVGSATPAQLDVLALVAENKYLATYHVALILGYSEKNARDHLRALYDLKPPLVERMAVSGNMVGSQALLAHNAHKVTAAGLRLLADMGLVEPGKRASEATPSLYLGHELAVRDVLAWFSVSGRTLGHWLEKWDCSGRLDMGGAYADAVFAYRTAEPGKGPVVAGFVEVDMGTQKSLSGKSDRWAAKVEIYSRLFSPEERERRKSLLGYANGVLLVTVPDAKRADWVLGRVAGSPMASYTLVGIRTELVPPAPKREPGKPAGKRPPLPDARHYRWRRAAGESVALAGP